MVPEKARTVKEFEDAFFCNSESDTQHKEGFSVALKSK